MKYIAAITRKRTSGFALVVTLCLMILLTIIAVGFLSMATITVRTSSHDDAMATARANARMSLMLAIGELQRHAGPDTRVTARADILDENNPAVLGVWRSWEGTNHEVSGPYMGRPISPGSDYQSVKQDRFLAWLTSATSEESLDAATPGSTKITLLGEGSVGTGVDPVTGVDREKLQIHLPPTFVSTDKKPGAFAWWIGGENQKAFIPKPEADANRGAAARKQAVSQAKSHSIADPNPFELESVLTDPRRGTNQAVVHKAVSLKESDFITPDQSGQTPQSRRSARFFHDLTTDSVGLLTNTGTGGWRKDMSLLSEKWSDQAFPKTNLPLFRLSPESVLETQVNSASVLSPFQAGSLFYPWMSYTNLYNGGLQQPVSSWDNLIDYVKFYKRSDVTNAAGVRRMTTQNAIDVRNYNNTDRYNHLHKVRVSPVVARIQWVFSHFAEVSGPDPGNPSQNLYTPKLLMTPVITMWNPYNVQITVPHNMYFETKVIPVALSYQVGSNEPGFVPHNAYNCVLHINNTTRPTTNIPCLLAFDGGNGMYNTCGFPAGLVLRPGETKVFSPASDDRKVPNGIGGPWGASHTLTLQPGYRGSGGHLYPVRNQNGVVTAKPAATRLRANIAFDTEYNMQYGTNGVGTYLEIRTNDTDRYLRFMRTGYSATIARSLHPRILGNNTLEVQNLQQLVTTPQPFFSAIYGPRIATRVTNTVNTQYATKGFMQSSLHAHFPYATFRTPNGANAQNYGYPGTGHPINLGYEFSYVTHSSGGDDNLPNSGPGDTGYIISGVQSSNGLPRAIVADLPARPLASLGELVGWDIRFENPTPPFAYNLVGNSDASPIFPASAVYNPTDHAQKGTRNLRVDDSYCANHLLFDDWFFSTITEDPATFGGQARPQNIVYGQFLTGVTPLTNRAYKPLLEDTASVVAGTPSADLYNNFVNTNESWKTIASRLEVEGMFNVNSTSVAAWRALLGHARNQKVIRYTNTGSIAEDTIKQHPVSRFSISAEVEAGTPIAGAFPEASEVTGYRTLDDDFLDELAEEVVKQVRLRGPFLSLSEFVNRQLSEDKNLALAGALQAALNELSKNGAANNPLATLQGLSNPTAMNPPQGAAGDSTGYVFPEAAEGHSSYGVPGWTRQADILRPLAPILSARDDTFRIRSYGDARDKDGKIIAKAVCEAVVRRTRDYVDPYDAPESTASLISDVNNALGRRYEIISFRWLNFEEI